ncbi:hypothetical protein [Paraburkholderia kururiensis]|jgi:hypothetical protein|nr:hypothetical protein [Paraburkholderia kururiensis]
MPPSIGVRASSGNAGEPPDTAKRTLSSAARIAVRAAMASADARVAAN